MAPFFVSFLIEKPALANGIAVIVSYLSLSLSGSRHLRLLGTPSVRRWRSIVD